MQILKLSTLFLSIFYRDYNKIIVDNNKITCSGILGHTLCRELNNELISFNDRVSQYTTPQTIKFVPLYLKIHSVDGNPQAISTVIDTINNKIDCKVITMVNDHIGGNSIELFKAGDQKLFHPKAKLYILNPNLNDRKIKRYIKLNSTEAVDYL